METPEYEERLIQPTDPIPGEGLPPTYSAGNLPPGEPFEAVGKVRTKFYGPVEGPFAIITRDETQQTADGWRGFIAVDAHGFARPVSQEDFDRAFDVVGRDVDIPAADNTQERHPLTFVPDIDQLREVDPAMRSVALQIQYKAAFDDAVRACVAAGLIDEATRPEETMVGAQDLDQPTVDDQLEDLPTTELLKLLDQDEIPAAKIHEHLNGRAAGGDPQAVEWQEAVSKSAPQGEVPVSAPDAARQEDQP